ncbi:MAG: tRNA (N(6)-L-threonylcarbamoyladenosine(37)-C(2))-methylthiotransferase MtaB [Firmicutes bacterium]|nr:tRNA (N(6)-L-threonylcarbamoyladenosine(37)-C(2))-methylthiotransferase MtaB [Bacillota bacterium]
MKFNIITLGCKVNTYESNFMKESLIANGFSFCNEISKCDLIIINTCSVTDTSDKKSLKTVRRARRENPLATLVVCGCSTQYNANAYNDLGIDILLGNKEKSKIVELVTNFIKYQESYEYITHERKLPFEDMEITKFDHVRAFIKVQDGCNNFCSYCIIPYVRGDLRCKAFNKVICEVKNLAKNGYKEVVLTGIHTGSYNDSGKDLCDLIEEISLIEGIKRIRLSSVEITELNAKFMNLLRSNKVFCNHLHVPLQSGCDEILKIMNRKYDTDYYRNKIKEIREISPDISITTDVIVGHNYETDELFAKTYDFCKEINFSKIHVFPYSKRTGTASSKMDGEVDEKIKKERCKKLITLSDSLEVAYYNKFKGQKLDVLIETSDNNESVGHTSNYLRIVLKENLKVNEIYQREIV